jgi:hypothetical protein
MFGAETHQRLQPLLAHAGAPARQRRAIEHQPMLEELLAAEVLVIRVLDPALAQHFIGQIISVLEDPPSIASKAAGGRDYPKRCSRNPQSTVRPSVASGCFVSMI